MPRFAKLPKTVWILGFVSLFTDISSELIFALLPLLMAETLGLSVFLIGIIDGFAEGAALAVKVFSGYLSDRWQKRKPLVLLGYGLAALSKPLFPLATSASWVLAARLADRLGKGIRGAPRDALIADVTEPAQRGSAYGLRQALDTLGAVIGPALAIFCMWFFAGDIHSAMWVAVIPGFVALILLCAIRESPVGEKPAAEKRSLPRFQDLNLLPKTYWWTIVLGSSIMLARTSEIFLILRGVDLGLEKTWAPAVMVAMNLVYSLAAFPAGKLSDSRLPRPILALGVVCLLLSHLALAMAAGIASLFLGVALWGLHMGLTQSVIAALVSRHAPEPLRGTAFGFYNLVSGLMLLVAGTCSGWLWDTFGASSPFWFGAALTLICVTIIANAKSILAMPIAAVSNLTFNPSRKPLK